MTDSRIAAAFTALLEMSVTAKDKTPTVYSLTGIPNSIPTPDLPVRIIIGMNGSGKGKSISYQTLGDNTTRVMVATWQITDLMLWKPLGQGRGLREVSDALVEYAAHYIDAVRANRDLLMNVSIEDLQLAPGVYRYPADSNSDYFGVGATVTIQEILE